MMRYVCHVVFLCGFAFVFVRAGQGGDSEASRFKPVAPASAIRAALTAHAKLTRDWITDGDYVSAGETAQGMNILAHLLHARSEEPRWQAFTKPLVDLTKEVTEAAKSKDAASVTQLLGKLEQQLQAKFDETQDTAAGTQRFKPPASVKPLMKLLEGTYSDAKAARSIEQLRDRAFTLAETANVVIYLRTDKDWRAAAAEARDAALAVARQDPTPDLQAARASLKNVYRRCEACHETQRD